MEFVLQIIHPLRDKNSISARLDAVSEIAESMGSCSSSQNLVVLEENSLCNTFAQIEISNVLSSVFTALGKSPDVQRGITRIFHQTATAAEVIIDYLFSFLYTEFQVGPRTISVGREIIFSYVLLNIINLFLRIT